MLNLFSFTTETPFAVHEALSAVAGLVEPPFLVRSRRRNSHKAYSKHDGNDFCGA